MTPDVADVDRVAAFDRLAEATPIFTAILEASKPLTDGIALAIRNDRLDVVRDVMTSAYSYFSEITNAILGKR